MDFARMPTGAVPRFETGGIGIARNGPYGMNARRATTKKQAGRRNDMR